MQSLLIHNGRIVTPTNIIDNGAVCCDSDTICDVGPAPELKKRYPKAKKIDAKGLFVAPGLINLHTHLYSAFARWLDFPGGRPANFIDILKNIWWRLDKALTHEDVYYSALVGLIDAVKCGTTTVIDHHASPNCVRGSLERIEEAIQSIPIRASLCYEVSDRDGEKVAHEGIEENAGFIETHQCVGSLRGLFGLHASFTVSEETLRRCADVVSRLDAGIHTHTSEDRADTDDCRKRYGMGVVERWESYGLLGPKSLLAHCVHIDEAEKDILAATRTNVALNPQSNANNRVGEADIKGILERGVSAGLGTDGMTMDMFDEAGFLVRKGMRSEADRLLFRNNPEIVSKLFGTTIGRLERGAAADIIIADKMEAGGVRTTIAGGKVLMEEREIVGVDEEEIIARSRGLANRLRM